MAFSGRRQQPWLLQRHGGRPPHRSPWRINQFPLRLTSSRTTFRIIIILLACIALLPPIFFHFRLRHFHQMQSKKCGFVNYPPLVCAHGGDSAHAFPNTMAAYHLALRSKVDCIEIDVSRSLDGVLFALHDRDLQRISGNNTLKAGQLTMNEIKELGHSHHSVLGSHDQTFPILEDALMLVLSSVRRVILDAKVGPPLYEKGLAKDILSIIERTYCKSCLVWSKSDSLARDVIKLSRDVTAYPTWDYTVKQCVSLLCGGIRVQSLKSFLEVGYIVMVDSSTGARSNLLRIKGAGVVGVYHPLVSEKLVKILHGRDEKVYAWTVDDVDSMRKLLLEHVDAIITNNPNRLQRLMQDIRTQCHEEGFLLSR